MGQKPPELIYTFSSLAEPSLSIYFCSSSHSPSSLPTFLSFPESFSIVKSCRELEGTGEELERAGKKGG